jgi:hypothetical protein
MMKASSNVFLTCCSAIVFGMTPLGPASAQQPAMVKVDVKNVMNDIAANAGIEASHIPPTIETPIDVAAKVCGVSAATLSNQKSGSAGCTATTTSPGLEKVVQDRVKANQQQPK